MKIQAIVAAGGVGKRLKSRSPKPLVQLNGKPLIAYCLEIFERCSFINSVIVVADKKSLKNFIKIVKRYRFKKVSHVIPGGVTRSDSVFAGLKVLDSGTKLVVVHDAARPFVDKQLIKKTISACLKKPAAIAAVKVKPTIKEVDPKNLIVSKTLNRNSLWEVQTPQTFKKDILIKAHTRARQKKNVTDDAALVEQLGLEVQVVEGSYRNIKITTPEDLIIAEALLKFGN